MKKQRIKIILMCAIIAIVFGGIVVKKQMSSNAAQPLTKEYFRLKENATTVFSKHVYVPQGMCIDGDTAYIAVSPLAKHNWVHFEYGVSFTKYCFNPLLYFLISLIVGNPISFFINPS